MCAWVSVCLTHLGQGSMGTRLMDNNHTHGLHAQAVTQLCPTCTPQMCLQSASLQVSHSLLFWPADFSFCHSAQGKQQNKQYGWYCICGFWNKEGTRDSEEPYLVSYFKEYYNVTFKTKQGGNWFMAPDICSKGPARLKIHSVNCMGGSGEVHDTI